MKTDHLADTVASDLSIRSGFLVTPLAEIIHVFEILTKIATETRTVFGEQNRLLDIITSDFSIRSGLLITPPTQ